MKTASFLPDVSRQAGSGHLNRCVALAEALQDLDWDCTIYADTSDVSWFLAEEYSFRILTPSQVSNEPCDALIVDSYLVQPSELNSITAKLRVAIADSLPRTFFDVVIDPNLTPSFTGVSEKQRLLQGPQYALLRKSRRKAAHTSTKVSSQCRVLFTFGGTSNVADFLDPCALIKKLPNSISVAIVDPYGSKLDGRSSRTKLIGENRNRMSFIEPSRVKFDEFDLVVSAAGTTMLELLHSGVPSMYVAINANQRQNLHRIGDSGLGMSIGDFTLGDDIESNLVEGIRQFLSTRGAFLNRARQGQFLIDGLGAVRGALKIDKAVRHLS